jgi:hypothetical protein
MTRSEREETQMTRSLRWVETGFTMLAVGSLALWGAAAGAAEVQVDYDTHTDFSRYKTWSWREGGTPAPNPVADKRLHEAIETRLQARGLQRVDHSGDLQVIYHAAGENQIGVEKLGYKEPEFETEATRVTYVRVGTVLLDMIDASTGKVVWRGQAQGAANPNYKDITLKIDGAIEKLFQHFPPGKR